MSKAVTGSRSGFDLFRDLEPELTEMAITHYNLKIFSSFK